jgi:hypothetical protein
VSPEKTRRRRGKYGKLPADPYKPAIRLSRSLTGVVPVHPPAADYLARLGNWQMLGNDAKGDCVAVTWANTRRLVTATLTDERYPSLADTLKVYATQNAGGADNGMVIQTLLGWLAKNAPPDGVKALGFAKVDHTNPDEVKAAIAIFGSVWTGIGVLQANETQFDSGQPWDYVSGSPDVGGHSIIVGGYGPPQGGALGGDERFITWAAETSFTDAFWQKLVDECWAVIWPEHLGSKAFQEGVDLAAFAADYTAITGKPFPVPVPLPPLPPPPPPPPVPPVPVPVPPMGPDVATPADVALAGTLGQWPFKRHVGPNKAAAQAIVAWEHAKNLGPG